MKLLRLIGGALLLCGSLGAEPWDALRSLKAGDRIRVLETSGQESKGSFVRVSADAIAFVRDNTEVLLERPRVRRVKVRSGSRRVRNTLIGAGVGLALGVVIDQTLGTYYRNESSESSAARALTYLAPTGIVAGIAAAFPAYKTVYKGP